MPKVLAAAGLVLALGGCAHGQVNQPVPMTGCEHPTGWSDQVRAAASETWLYAQMAANAYRPPNPFDLGEGVVEVERADNDKVGFAYVIYERRPSDGAAASWVIAYRGTENDQAPLVDWFYGNLLGAQNARGLKVYQTLRHRVGDAAEIVVTGHSLGGGIATHVSLCAEGATSYVFNSSPRFWRCGGGRVENVRQSIVEMGEVLRIARGPLAEATQRYTALNCVRRGGAIYQHGMPLLARCLTDIAAWADTGAQASLQRNHIAWPPAEAEPVVLARRRTCAAGA